MSGFIVTEGSLRTALDAGYIHPVFQPVYQAPVGIPTGLEILARWCMPDGYAVPTDVFIAQAMRSGLETAIARTLLENAIPSVCTLARILGQPLIVGINAGPQSLADPTFLVACASFIASCRGAGVSLAVEVTEREPLLPELTSALKRLKSTGAVLVLDDFGTGYAKADVLTWLQPDIVKLDRSLTVLAGKNDSEGRLADALKAVDSIGAKVLAEGVENTREYNWLLKHGVRLYQGYLFGRPTSSETIVEVMRSGSIVISQQCIDS